jgi:hypothetical protein
MEISKIDGLVQFLRGQRVLLDRDLAGLYGVRTKALNQAVKRHMSRFPSDFMFKLTPQETRNWRSQIVTSNLGLKMGHRRAPYAFTEQGVAMLSSVLNSERAVQVNVAIMRAFVRLRSAILTGGELGERVRKLERTQEGQESELGEHAVQIHEVFAAIRTLKGTSRRRK